MTRSRMIAGALVMLLASGCADGGGSADSAPPADTAREASVADAPSDAPSEAPAADVADEAAAGWPCSKIMSCVTACDGSVSCAQVCVARGTPHAQTLVADFLACWDRVKKDQCTVCNEAGKRTECGTCVAFACLGEGAVCLLDT